MMMILLVVVVVGVSAYVWCMRGFFSSLLHLACVIAAGAIAFGVYEPVGYMLLDASPDRGAFSFLSGVAWAVALGLPFALSLALLRYGVDKLLPANAQCETTVDYVGGGVCGLGSGIITAGIIVLCIGLQRFGPDFGGYQPVIFTQSGGRGSLEHTPNTTQPWVDRITAGLYEKLSLTTLRTSEPLARWHPDLASEVGAMRLTYEDKSRNTTKPDSFRLLGWYTVGAVGGGSLAELLKDEWNPAVQKVTDLDGEPINQGYLAGFVVLFNTKAREKTGQVVVGNGQVRLVVQSREDEDDTRAIHPVACVTNVDDPSQIAYERFRYDGDAVYFASVGGASETPMAFEFPIPTGYLPIALYVKGVRVEIDPRVINQVPNYPTTSERDAEIRAGKMQGMGDVGQRTDDQGNPIPAPDNTPVPGPRSEELEISNAIGFILQKGQEGGGLELVEPDEGRGWAVESADAKFRREQLQGFGRVERNLQIAKFATTRDTVVVKVDMTPANHDEEYNRKLTEADKSKPPVLVDGNGTTYEPVGFIYNDGAITQLRYTRNTPIHRLSDLPAVSRSSPNKTLKLVYSVSYNVEITELRIGDTVLSTFSGKKTDVRQR